METAYLRQCHFDGEGDDQGTMFHADGGIYAVAELIARRSCCVSSRAFLNRWN